MHILAQLRTAVCRYCHSGNRRTSKSLSRVPTNDEVQNEASYEETGGFRLRTLYSQKVVRN